MRPRSRFTSLVLIAFASALGACTAIGGLDKLHVDDCFDGCEGDGAVPPAGSDASGGDDATPVVTNDGATTSETGTLDGGDAGSSTDSGVDTGCPTGFATCGPTECSTAVVSDRFNCGACGHDCGGGDCLAGVCQPFALATGQQAPIGLNRKDDMIYFAAADGVKKVSINGGAVTPLYSGTSRPLWMNLTSTEVFWLDGANNIDKVQFDGSNHQRLQSTVATLWDFQVDDSFIYYNSGHNMERASASASGNATRLSQVGAEIYAVTSDATTLYFFDANGSAYSLPKSAGPNSTATTLGTGGQTEVQSSVNDATTLYWITIDGFVQTLPKTGGTIKLLAQGLGTTIDIGVDDKFAYVTAETGILKVPLDGSAVSVMAAGLNSPQGILSEGPVLFFTTTDGKVMKLVK